MGTILLLLVLAVMLLLNLAATIMVLRDEYGEPRQRVFQAIFIWVVPLMGALLVLGIHRRPQTPSRSYAADYTGSGDGCAAMRSAGRGIADLADGD